MSKIDLVLEKDGTFNEVKITTEIIVQKTKSNSLCIKIPDLKVFGIGSNLSEALENLHQDISTTIKVHKNRLTIYDYIKSLAEFKIDKLPK